MRFFNHRRHGHIIGSVYLCISHGAITAHSITWDSVRTFLSGSRRIGRAVVLLYWRR